MTQAEQNVRKIIEKGQSGDYDLTAPLIRNFTGDIRHVLDGRNPLCAAILITRIERIVQIFNPALEKEIEWFQQARHVLGLWSNDIVSSNRLLGLKNDNEFDRSVFEKAIVQHFYWTKKPSPETIMQTDFKTLVDLVELGARRFGVAI